MSKENKGPVVSNRDTVQDNWNARHDKFQSCEPKFEGHNPMVMSNFEKECVSKEKAERHMAKIRYQLGIQGVDGGRFPRSQT